MSYATCRGCGDAFKKEGWGRQSEEHPRLCRDCVARERSHHGRHAPDVECVQKYFATDYARDPRD